MASEVKSPGTKANEVPDSAITHDDNPTDESRLKFIRERFQVMSTFWAEIFAVGQKDDQMVAGEHWPEDIKKERQEDRRPLLTYNLFPAFNRQITNRMRQERQSVKVTPVDTDQGADPRMENVVGTRDYSLAEVYGGIIKNIETISRADQAYDTAAKHAVDHGFGYFYMMPQWSKIDPFVQELVIHRVKNSYTVMLGPEAEEADYRDMPDAFMFKMMHKSTFEKKYPNARASDFAEAMQGASFEGWYNADEIRVAQYLWIDHKDDKVVKLSNGKIHYMSVVEPILDDLKKEFGIHVQKTDSGKEMIKAVKRPVCMWQKMTANEILEGPLELPFSSVPIYPVFGEEVIVDGKTSYESAIRHAKDAARSYNYWRTAASEAVALAPRAPWVLTAKQIAGHKKMYEQANRKNLPYLLYNQQEGVPPPQRAQPASPAAAELANATHDGADMQTIIGLHDASLGKEGNEKSGKAILARQDAGTTATFQFPDNQGRALEQMGRNAVEAIPQLYDTNRIVRIRLPDGNDDFVQINQAVKDGKSGNQILIHDIAYGQYDVVLEAGSAYATQRQEAADLQMELLKVLGPDRAANIVHLIVQNLGVPGSDEVAAVLRKMLPTQLKSEEEKMADLPKGVSKDPETGQLMDENGEPWQPEPSIEQQIMMKQQQIDELEHNANIEKHKATQAKAQADLKEAEKDLQALQMQQSVEGEQNASLDDMMKGVEDIISKVMQEHMDNPKAHAAMNIEKQISDAIVDALKRVRGYVDRQVSELIPVEADMGTGEDVAGDLKKSAINRERPVVIKLGDAVQEKDVPDLVKIEPTENGGFEAIPVYKSGDTSGGD